MTTLPITLLIVLIKLGIVHLLHYDGLVKFSEVGIVVTGGIFLIGFIAFVAGRPDRDIEHVVRTDLNGTCVVLPSIRKILDDHLERPEFSRWQYLSGENFMDSCQVDSILCEGNPV